MTSNNQQTIDTVEEDKEGMVEGNDGFLRLIDKMFESENEYRQLSLKMRIIKLKESHFEKVKTFIKNKMTLEQQVQTLNQNQVKLEKELDGLKAELHDIKKRYEEQKEKTTETKERITTSKKDVDQTRLDIVDLMADESFLKIKLDLLRAGYDEEIKKLESQVQKEKRVILDSNKRSLDLEPIIESLEAHYAEIADRAKEEAEQLNQKKMDVLVQTAKQRQQELRNIDKEIIILKTTTQSLQEEVEIIRIEEESLQSTIKNMRQSNDDNGTQPDITQLEESLKTKKDNLADQVRKHQELLNLKLALDMEIATYRELLKNEEESLKNSTTGAGAS